MTHDHLVRTTLISRLGHIGGDDLDCLSESAYAPVRAVGSEETGNEFPLVGKPKRSLIRAPPPARDVIGMQTHRHTDQQEKNRADKFSLQKQISIS